MVRALLQSKAELQVRDVGTMNRGEPTCRRCSACGDEDSRKALSVCGWKCSGCGGERERGVNAAGNTLAVGLGERVNACGGEGQSSLLIQPAGVWL